MLPFFFLQAIGFGFSLALSISALSLSSSWLVGGCGRTVAVVDVDGRGGCGAAALPDGGRGKAGEDCPRSASHRCLYLGQRLNIWN